MSHRAYQPILPTGNKLLQKRWDQTYYDEHRRQVGNINKIQGGLINLV